MIFYCRHCVHWHDYGLPLRLHLSNQVHQPCIRSSKRNAYGFAVATKETIQAFQFGR